MATRKEVNVGTAENGPAKKSKVSRVGERRGANGVNRRKLHRGGLCAAGKPAAAAGKRAAKRGTGEDRTNERAI